MSTFQDLIKTMQEQKEKFQSPFGLSSFQRFTEVLSKHSNFQNQQYRLNEVTDLSRVISPQLRQLNTTLLSIGEGFSAQLRAIQIPRNSLLGLSSTFSEIAKINPQISDLLSGFALSQISLSLRMAALAKQSQTHLRTFNSLNVALKDISNSFLQERAFSHNWNDIRTAEEVNEVIVKFSDEILKEQTITLQDLDNLKHSILSDLNNLLTKTKTEKAFNFILNLMTIIGFLLTLYSQKQVDVSNRQVIEQTKREIENLNIGISTKISAEFQKFCHSRISLTNVNLRFSAKKSSKKIGLVRRGQQVTVIEIWHKYLLISYIDIDTGEPKSGFVVKKYFQRMK